MAPKKQRLEEIGFGETMGILESRMAHIVQFQSYVTICIYTADLHDDIKTARRHYLQASRIAERHRKDMPEMLALVSRLKKDYNF